MAGIATIDRSSGLASAIGGTLAKDLPGAIAEQKKVESERQNVYRDTTDKLKEAAAVEGKLKLPEKPHFEHPPDFKETQPAQQWGSLAMAMAMLGSAFTRQPFLNSLNSGAAVLNAYHSADAASYKRSFDRWKAETDYATKMYEYERDAYKDALDRVRAGKQDALAELRTLTASMKDPVHDLLQRGQVAEAIATLDMRHDAAEKHKVENAKLAQQGQLLGHLTEARAALRANPADPEAQARVKQAEQAVKDWHFVEDKSMRVESTSQGREAAMRSIVDTKVQEYRDAHPNATQSELDKAQADARVAAERQFAEATRAPRSAPAMFIQKYLEEHPDATSADVSRAAAGYTREQTIERAFAGGVDSRNMTALNTVADHSVLLREYATALKNGELQRVNSVLNRFARETGQPNITNFELARDFFADEVVRVLTATGGGVTDREEAKNRISAAGSPEQLLQAIDTAGRFIGGRLHALEQRYARNDPERRKEFESEMLTPTARELFSTAAPRSATPSPASGGGGASTPPSVPDALKGVKLRGWSPSAHAFVGEDDKLYDDKTGAAR